MNKGVVRLPAELRFMPDSQAPPAARRPEPLEGVAVQMKGVGPGKPNHQMPVRFDSEAQCSAPSGQLLDSPGKVKVVSVTLAALFAAALQPFAGVEYQVKVAAAALHLFDPVRRDKPVQVLQSTEVLALVKQPRQSVFTPFGCSRPRFGCGSWFH